MKMKLAILGALLTSAFFTVQPAGATVTCSNVPTTTTWPAADAVQKCNGTGTTSHSGLVRETIENIGSYENDAAIRLKEIQQTQGDIVNITITDSSLPGGSITVSHVITSADSLYTVANDLAKKIRDISGGEFFAFANGSTVSIYSYTGNTTTYSGTVRNPGDTAPGSETITFSDDGFGNKIATIDGTINAAIKWFAFANAVDFLDNSRNGPPKVGPQIDPRVDGNETGFTEWYDIPFERNAIVFESSSKGANNTVAHTTAHETGHHLDRIYGRALGDGVKMSTTQVFIDALEIDLAKMNLLNSCAEEASDGQARDGDPNVPSGGYYASSGTTIPGSDGGYGGLYTNLKDANGVYVCNGSQGLGRGVRSFSGTNLDILKAAYPYFNETYNVPSEMFAEIYSMYAGYTDLYDNSNQEISGSDTILTDGASYLCTKLYVEKLTSLGRMPTAEELHNTGYPVPQTVTGGPDDGKLGYGTVLHSCDGTIANDVDPFSFGS